MILWIITIGGLASIGSVNQPWFIKLLAQLCRAAGIAGQAELASLLADFLWSGFYLGHIFNGFWADLRGRLVKAVHELDRGRHIVLSKFISGFP